MKSPATGNVVLAAQALMHHQLQQEMQSATLTETDQRTGDSCFQPANQEVMIKTRRHQRRPASFSSFDNSCPATTDEPRKCSFKVSFVFLTFLLCSAGRFLVQNVSTDGFGMSGSTSTPQTDHRFPRLRQEMNPAVKDSGTCSVSCAVTRGRQWFVF